MQFIAESSGFEARALNRVSDFFCTVEEWEPTHIALDLLMPEMDGVQVLEQLGELGCTARIILTSGVSTRVLDAARRSGDERGLDIAGVLPKPFQPDALRQLLSQPPPPARVSPVEMPTAAHPSGQPTPEELSGALLRGHIDVAYQPQFRCANGRFCGVEALVRWRHPQFGELTPDRFLPMAEQQGMMESLTSEVLGRALDWFTAHLPDHGIDPPPTLSVNISATSLGDAAFVDRLAHRCQLSGINPSRVIFELTETCAMKDPVTSLEILTRLRMKGFQLSIDDFGTGYSSMLQLVRLPFSEIKVDKSFVKTALQSAESLAVVRSIIELGRSLNMRVVGEGVEDTATLRLLCELGCGMVQGFLLGRPARGEQLAKQLAQSPVAGNWPARTQG